MAAVFVALASACSNMSEGERCNVTNGSDDCADGLICYKADQLNGTVSDRCCPSDRARATTTVCRIGVSGIADAAVPPDTGPTVDASGDASSDASDASDDATSDASFASDQ